MARLFVTGINLNKNELQNARVQNLSSAPSSPVAGQIYFDTTAHVLYFYDGTNWVPASGSTEVIQDVIGSSVIGGTGLTATYVDGDGETTINLDNTAVTSGSYGSTAAKTVSFTVDQQGRLTSASEQDIQITTSQVTGLQEFIEDSVNTVVAAGEGIDVSYDDAGNTYTVSAEDASDTNKGVASFSSTDFTVTSGNVEINHESIADIVGAMTTGNTETGITVTYQDLDNTLDFSVDDQFPSHTTSDLAEGTNLYYTAERVQDEISTAIVAGTGLDSTYNDGAGTLTIDIDSTVTTNDGTQTLTNKTLGSGTALGANLNADGSKIVDLGTPTDDTDAATKAYVDARVAGMTWKQSVNLLYNDSTPTLSGDSVTSPLVIDGHAALDLSDVGYRILINSGNDAGIYVYSQTGTSWTLNRATDADVYTELIGASVYVMEGTSYGSTTWVQANHYLTDFTGQSWAQSSGAGTYSAGNGLQLDGTTFSVKLDSDSLSVSGSGLKANLNVGGGLDNDSGIFVNTGTGLTLSGNYVVIDTANGYGVRKYATSIGDASATSYTVNHALGTKDLTVQVYDNSSPYAQVEADVEHTDSNNVTVKFAEAPTLNQYRVVVVG